MLSSIWVLSFAGGMAWPLGALHSFLDEGLAIKWQKYWAAERRAAFLTLKIPKLASLVLVKSGEKLGIGKAKELESERAPENDYTSDGDTMEGRIQHSRDAKRQSQSEAEAPVMLIVLMLLALWITTSVA